MFLAVAAECAVAPGKPLEVLHNWVSEFIISITHLSESLYTILSALSTLLDRYVRYYETSILLLLLLLLLL